MAALADTEDGRLLIASLASRLPRSPLAFVMVAGFCTDVLVSLLVLVVAALGGAGLLCTFFAVQFCLLSTCAEL